MSYVLNIIKDKPVMFLPLDETSGSVAYDISGCGNNGTHSDGIVSGLLPLIPGGATGTTITNTKYIDCSLTKNYYGQNQVVSFGQDGFSDNEFSMEIWLYPKFNLAENLIFGDQVNDIGISWHNGNIIFKLQSEIIEYTVPYYGKSLHIVATYNIGRMSIYIDGQIVATKELNNFKFTNTYLNISIGPTSGSDSSFVVDAPAIYRYGLSDVQIKRHYDIAQIQIDPLQIVEPDGGTLFALSDENTKEIYQFSYPVNRSMMSLVRDGLSYDTLTNSIYLTPTDISTAIEVEVIEKIAVPSNPNIAKTKIRWAGDNGISISTSNDGVTYVLCENGNQIPQYENGVSNGGELYIKIVFTSSDASRYNPELYSLWLSFYDTAKAYAKNHGEFLYTIGSLWHTLGDINLPILSRDKRNGLRVIANNKSFLYPSATPFNSIEFFYTRHSSDPSGFFYIQNYGQYAETMYSWDSSGAVSSSNIDAIYINGIDRTASSNIASILLVGEIYHIVIIFSGPANGMVKFSNKKTTNSSCKALYQNIAIYPDALTPSQAIQHYELYTSRPLGSVEDNDITITESGITYNTNDWIVLQSI